ncbi:MAG TPA: FAD-binding oxidoreductase [Candidatus Binataceae bacterium]|nr:FAD-binding oxidoreductase [Candidatus Binataceae bacterium]
MAVGSFGAKFTGFGYPLSRRQFLSHSMRAVAGVGVGLSLLDFGCSGGSSTSANARAWQELAQRISGPVLRPGDPGFAALAMPNNLRYAATLPAGIARCLSAQDVSQAILWARQNDIPLVARSGGHSYAGYSTTNGLMIDLKLINQIQYDSGSGIVTIGGGVLNSALYQALQPLGVAITHGRCPTVGAAGFLLGGGIGFNMRAHALGCDQLVATEIVTADGQILIPSPQEDLFWACQGGGGGNFGINTSFSLQTFPVPSSLTVFSLSWSARPDAVYAALLAALQTAPTTLGSRVQLDAITPQEIAAGQDVTVRLLGQLVGTPGDLADILQPVYAVAEPTQSTINQMSYWDAQINFLATPGKPAEYQERSRFFVGPPSSAAIATALQWARRWPGTSVGADLVLFQTGGQINIPAADATAFVHRDSDWLMTIALSWSGADAPATVEANLAWQSDFYQAMTPYAGGGAYQNFIDPSLTDWAQEYYGSNLPRLQNIKAVVDPTLVFDFPEAITPA